VSGPRYRPAGRVERLSVLDLMFLRVESAAWPCHFGGLAVVDGTGLDSTGLDGTGLLDGSGRLRLEEIAEELGRRLAQVPQLRRRLLFPGPLLGRPLWVDDDRFDIHRHLHQAVVDPPGGDNQLLDAAARICESLLDRTRPLWELWFLTGLADGRVGVLLKLHHAVADGIAAVTIMASLFDPGPAVPAPAAGTWAPQRAPTRRQLLADNLAAKRGQGSRAAAALAHPVRLARAVQVFAGVARQAGSPARASRTSLNRRVEAGRRIRFLRLDLAAVKHVAHAHQGKVNDVVLTIFTGGLRRLLAARGELAPGLELVTTMPASSRAAGSTSAAGNELGAMALPLPVWQADAGRLLDRIADRTREAKAGQHPAAAMGLIAWLSATPLGRYFAAHQHAAHVEVTNVAGPSAPVSLFGARVLAILPIVGPVGNLGPVLCAFSYAGQLVLVVTADARGFPDLDVLMAGMESDACALLGNHPGGEPVHASADGFSALDRP
jgi:diacylglycerol O-acyltransferase / wax synthase